MGKATLKMMVAVVCFSLNKAMYNHRLFCWLFGGCLLSVVCVLPTALSGNCVKPFVCQSNYVLSSCPILPAGLPGMGALDMMTAEARVKQMRVSPTTNHQQHAASNNKLQPTRLAATNHH
jgi:hypothetical protein